MQKKSYRTGLLWNEAEKAEDGSTRTKTARTAREVEIALPIELNREENIELVRAFVKKEFVNKGMCVDYSIHAGHKHSKSNEFKDAPIKDNPHVHYAYNS
jgi:ATP-dependent exoDNAse (exonuclease V) alpha subunit